MTDFMKGMKRTGLCTRYGMADQGKEITVMGWVNKRRDLGGVIFIDLRDVSGIIQVVFRSEKNSESFKKAETLRSEYVVAVRGKVIAREKAAVNPKLQTGEIEVEGMELRILSEAKTPPIDMDEDSDTNELTRLQYRYLDLRRPDMQKNLIMRSRLYKSVRDFFHGNGFHEIETPVLTKSTPEGARDYLVPSRVNKGTFYALPQSPQIFKQLLMVSGFDRYMQITKCYRDEDLRRDRQPEFTQIDLEMSFVDVDDVLEINERFLKNLVKEMKGIDIAIPFRRMTYSEAMDLYGSDKPDTRFGLEIHDLTDIFTGSGFKVFSETASSGGRIKAVNLKNHADRLSRRDLDALVEMAKQSGAGGMSWMVVETDQVKSPILKFLGEQEIKETLTCTDACPNDILFLVSEANDTANKVLGNLRLHLAGKFGLIKDMEALAFLWVTDFPLFDYSEEENRYVSMHHPFTSPNDDQLHLLQTKPETVNAKAYDIVLNGNEIGGGSIRIYNREIQRQVFNLLGFSDQEAYERFGFLLDAFDYGVPPHGGIAYGFDRIAMIFAGCDNIRDVIAFPKIQNASCPLTNAPSKVDVKQLAELGIKTVS
ncbi:MAG: aspartate--tRNA ligase [Clostridia bacterium]